MENPGLLDLDVLEEVLDDLLLFAFTGAVDPVGAVLHLVALVDEQCRIATVVDDELGAEAVLVDEGLPGAPPVFLQGLTFPSEHRNLAYGDRGSSVVLGRENVTGNPAHFGTEICKGLDENRCLDRHVKRTHDAHALEWLGLAVFFPGCHQAWHLMLGDIDFLAAEVG